MYEPFIDKIKGKDVAWCQVPGNHGDHFIDRVAGRMLENNASSFTTFRSEPSEFLYSAEDVLKSEPEVVLWMGNGNLGGNLYSNIHQKFVEVCEVAEVSSVEVVVSPCTANSEFEVGDHVTVFAREHTTAEMLGCEFVPDLALDYDRYSVYSFSKSSRGSGLFLRTDAEIEVRHVSNIGDPAKIAESLDEYIGLASKYKKIVTNRLHFAIISLGLGKDVTLLPGSYHKNRSVYEASLEELGCQWSSDVPVDQANTVNNPFDYFDKINVLNLDEDEDMMRSFEKEARKAGIANRTQRFSAIKRRNGFKGNADSHLSMLRQARAEGVERLLILEDDCEFAAGVQGQLKRAIRDLQNREWAMFYLGIGWGPQDWFAPKPVGDYLFKLKHGWFIHAYAVNLEYPGLMQHIEDTHEGAIERHEAWDNYYSEELFDKFPCFCARDLLALQKQRISRTAKAKRNFVPQNILFFEQHKNKALADS